MNDYLLTPEEIGDNLDLEVEGTYPCSDGSSVMTISVDELLKAQLRKVLNEIKALKSPFQTELECRELVGHSRAKFNIILKIQEALK